MEPNIQIQVIVKVADPGATANGGVATVSERTVEVAVLAEEENVYETARANLRAAGNQALDWLHSMDGTEPPGRFPARMGTRVP